MDTCLLMDESLCYSHETMTALLIGYTPIQDKKIKKRKIALQRETGKGKAGEVACYSRAERGWPTKSTSGLPGSVSGRSEWPGKLWASFWGSGQVILSQAGWFPTPQTGLIQHLILQPHLPSPPWRRAGWAIIGQPLEPSEGEKHTSWCPAPCPPCHPAPPTARECWGLLTLEHKEPQTAGWENRNCLLPVSAKSIYFWVGPQAFPMGR